MDQVENRASDHTYIRTYVGLARAIYLYTVYMRFFWQENHQIYGHIRYISKVLANPTHLACVCCVFSREVTMLPVIYNVYLQFWPTQVVEPCV